MRIAIIIVGVIACRSAAPVQEVAPAPRHDAALLRSLVMLATGHEPSAQELADTGGRIDRGELTMPAFVDSLVMRPAFANDVAPLAILRHMASQNSLSTPMAFVLDHTKDDPPIYFLDKPCTAAAAQTVHPWWDLDHEVRVCTDSYRPDTWYATMKKGAQEIACLSGLVLNLDHFGGCGCGPNLFRCYTSTEQRNDARESLRHELRATIAYATQHDLPVEAVFTSNETFRDRYAEHVRLAGIVQLRRDAHPEPLLRELATWPPAGKWASREDLAIGQHAGILTAPQITFNMPDRRQRMNVIYDVLWCSEGDSVGASPEALLAIHGGDLEIQSAGWKELAGRPICTNCHARLDYGMQFFFGYPNASYQPMFMPDLQQHGRGPLYGRNIDDPRGEGDLHPQGFAKLATAQPEFGRCMARDFGEVVLGNLARSEQIAGIEATLRPGHTTLRDVMRTALLALVADWPERAKPTPAPSPQPESRPAAAMITVTPALHKLLDDECFECHEAKPERVDLSTSQLPRPTIVKMLDEIAFNRMPKDQPLAPTRHDALLEALIAATWSGRDADIARDTYFGRMRAVPAFRPELILSFLQQSAGAKATSQWRMMENGVRSDHQQVTPGLIGVSGLATIEACHAAHASRADVDACIANTMRVDNLAIDRR